MLEIALGAIATLSTAGLAGALREMRRKAALSVAQIDALMATKAMLDDYIITAEARIEEGANLMREAADAYQLQSAERDVAYGFKLSELIEAHADELKELKETHASQMEVGSKHGQRLVALLGGHEFRIGGKVVAHGKECILYNCVTCPPEANTRVVAPEGFFSGEVAGVDQG